MSDERTLPVKKLRLKTDTSIHSGWMKHSQDSMRTSCSWPKPVPPTINKLFKWEVLKNATLGSVPCCRNVCVVARHKLFDGSHNQFDVSPQTYTSVSGNTIPTALLSLENPRSHNQITATPRQSFYKVKSQSRGKPFRISVVCYLPSNWPRMFSLQYPPFVVQWFILELSDDTIITV